jgi:hypothetical protein
VILCNKLQIVCYITELDPFDENDGDVTLHHEEVHGPSVSFLTSDDDDDYDEHYGMFFSDIFLLLLCIINNNNGIVDNRHI